jgi:hypothetical protein
LRSGFLALIVVVHDGVIRIGKMVNFAQGTRMVVETSRLRLPTPKKDRTKERKIVSGLESSRSWHLGDNGSMLGSWKQVAELVGVAVAGRANADKEAAGERGDDWPESRRNVAQRLRPNPAFTHCFR